jgi:plastocyanin
MNKRLASVAIALAAGAAAAGLFASPSNSAANYATGAYCKVPLCVVRLTGTGPSPSNVKMHAGDTLIFDNRDSVTHTVVFANGRCSFTLAPGFESRGDCNINFSHYVGRYAYTVDGKFPGTVVTTPLRRLVTLTARTHTIRPGTRLTLHGRVSFSCPQPCYVLSGWYHVAVIVLARHDGKHPFRPIATVNTRFLTEVPGRWKLKVQPAVTTTYIAKATGQLPQGQVWTKARSRPFTVRARH